VEKYRGAPVGHRLARLFRLTGVANRTQLAAWAGAHGLYHPTGVEQPAPPDAPGPRRAGARLQPAPRRARPQSRLT
jgi:hypothetical protein